MPEARMVAETPSIGSRLPPEILCSIFELGDAKDQISSALVCKHWTGQAHHLLWNTRIIPLPALLGVFVPLASRSYVGGVRYGSIEMIDDTRRDRFLTRASSVACLFIEQPVPQSYIPILEDLTTSFGPICPNLKHLHVHHKVDITSTCAIFAAPSLRSVRIRQDSSWSSLALNRPSEGVSNPKSLVKTLSRTSPDIERLVTHFHLQKEYPFASFPLLQSLVHQGSFSHGVLRKLAEDCPSLRQLEVRGGGWHPAVPDGTEPPLLATLRDLDVSKVSDTDLAILIVRATRMPALKSLTLCLPHRPSKTIGATLSPLEQTSPMVESLRVFVPTRLVDCIPEPVVRAEAFQRLRSIALHVRATSMDDGDLILGILPEDMPSLTSLTLGFQSGSDLYEAPTGVTFAAMAELALRFPKLEHLQTSINADTMPNDEPVAPFSQLHSLIPDPLFLWRRDSERIAHRLALLAPGVRIFKPKIAVRTLAEDNRVVTLQQGDGNFRENVDFDEEKEKLETSFVAHQGHLAAQPEEGSGA